MRIGYTFWREQPVIRQLALMLDELCDFFVVVFPFWTDGLGVKPLKGKPFHSFGTIFGRILPVIKELGKPYWLKVQYHPMPGTLPKGAIPAWWPGYVNTRFPIAFSRMVGAIARGFASVFGRIVGYPPEVVIPGVELARLVNKLEWEWIVERIGKRFRTRVIYGCNFWQPIRHRFDWLIELVYRLGWGPHYIRRIMKGTPYENADGKLLAEIAYKAKIKPETVEALDAIGLSAYFYPSMEKGVDPARVTRDCRYILRFDYIEASLEWAWKLGKELVITEMGVIYNSPIADDRDAVVEWFVDSIELWEGAGVRELVIWDEVKPLWVIDALKIWRRK